MNLVCQRSAVHTFKKEPHKREITIGFPKGIRVKKISWNAAQFVDNVDATVPSTASQFLCVRGFRRSLAVCKESLIRIPFAACNVLPREPKFCAA